MTLCDWSQNSPNPFCFVAQSSYLDHSRYFWSFGSLLISGPTKKFNVTWRLLFLLYLLFCSAMKACRVSWTGNLMLFYFYSIKSLWDFEMRFLGGIVVALTTVLLTFRLKLLISGLYVCVCVHLCKGFLYACPSVNNWSPKTLSPQIATTSRPRWASNKVLIRLSISVNSFCNFSETEAVISHLCSMKVSVWTSLS